MTFEDLLQGLHAVVALKMGWAGFEPANSEESGFTVHRNWPTMRPALYKMIFSGLSVTSVKSTVISLLQVLIFSALIVPSITCPLV